jgi:subfamily B ATP-binding cassette protein MsbA
MLFSTLFDGVSLGMIVPLADKILSNKEITITTVKLPEFLQRIIQTINSIPAMRLLNLMAILVLILYLLKGLFGFWQGYLMNDVSLRVIRDMRNRLYRKFQNLSLDYYSQKRTGELVSRITNDVSIIQNSVTEGVTDLIYCSFQLILFATISFYIHWRLATISLILFPLIAMPILRMGKLLRKLSSRSQERIADINSTLFETISGVRIVKAFSMEDYEVGKFERQNQNFYKIMMKINIRSLLLGPVTEFIGTLGGIVVFVLGGREVIAGRLSFGVFGLFIGALLSLIRPFKKLSRVHIINQQALAAARRIFEVLDIKPSVAEKPGASILPMIRDKVIFEKVWFRYEDQNVLKDINLEVGVGEVVAFVGPSGVGKTTLVNLIPRFYDPTSGCVKIDGQDIREVSFKSLREQIGIVTQETILFNDTVRTNIAYGKPEAKDDEIERSARIANAHQFIMNMPKGYETIIGDRGFRLSGGEKQRLAIARAVLKNPPILILDEATSQLDTESERLVQEAIDRLMKGRTVFVIAHRLSTIRGATKIVLLDKGEVIEVGNHEELIKRGGLYKRLYQMQFKEEG